MYSLEFDLHALALNQLADILSTDPETTDDEVARFISRCPEIPIDGDAELGVMNNIYQQNISALASFSSNTNNEAFVDEIFPILLNYLKYLPKFSFEEDLTWKDYSLPDKLSGNIITELLNISIKSNYRREKVFKGVILFIDTLSNLLKCGDVICISTVVLPMLNGMFRALQLSLIMWNCNDFESLAHHLQTFVHNDYVQEIDKTLETVIQSTDQSLAYARKFLSRYSFLGYPLSSGGIIYGYITLMRNVLVRVMISNDNANGDNSLKSFKDLWNSLVNDKAKISTSVTENVGKALRKTYIMSLQYFSELTKIHDKFLSQGNDCPQALYAREIMSVSLDLSGVISLFLHEVDDEAIGYLTTSLFVVPQTPDLKVQISALDAATILALNFPKTTSNMIQTIRKFLITPSMIFELAVVVDNLSIHEYGILRLAHCLKAVSSEMSRSVIYNLLATFTTGGHERTSTSQKLTPPNSTTNSLTPDQISIYSSVSGTSRSEESRQQMLENIVCTVAGVACILKDEDITALCVSMLAPRLRNHTPALDVVILEKFVDLALISSEKIFSEIVQKFSDISRQSLSPDNKIVTTAVLRCQQDLANKIHCRPEFYELYLLKILSLFVEKGVGIQQTVAKNGKFQVTSLVGEIGILLPVLKTLLSHKDFKVHLSTSEEFVGLFRNLWFHCVLYGFVSEEAWVREWRDSLIVVAQKTPPLVLESARNYIEVDLEFNSVLIRGNSDQDLANVRASLSTFMPNRAYEIKYFSFAEVTFLLSVYHIEIMRSQMGQCSFIQRYLVNEGVNGSKLVGCMEEIGNQVIDVFIKECSNRMIAHTIDNAIRTQIRNLMIASCHRLSKVHQLAIKHLDSLMSTFPSLLCDKSLSFLLLELIELVWQSCESEYTNEYSPVFAFPSVKVGVTLYLSDSYDYRKEMLTRLCESSKKWFLMAISRAPYEVRGLLEEYLAEFDHSHAYNTVHMGCSIALEIGSYFTRLDPNTVISPRIPAISINNVSELIHDYSARRYYFGQVTSARHWMSSGSENHTFDTTPDKKHDVITEEQIQNMRDTLTDLGKKVRKGLHVTLKDLNNILYLAAGMLVSMSKPDEDIVHSIVWIPVYLFTSDSIKLGISIWNWVINEKLTLEKRVMNEVASGWIWTLRNRKGLFSPLLNVKDPFVNKMQYAPSDKATRDRNYKHARHSFHPHLIWLEWLSGRFHAFGYRCAELVNLYVRLFQTTLDECQNICNHPLSREGRLHIIIMGFKILQSNKMEASIELRFRIRIFKAAFTWFSLPPRWSYGGNRKSMITEYKLLIEVYKLVENDKVELCDVLSTAPKKLSQFSLASPTFSIQDRDEMAKSKRLFLLFLESEINNLSTWINPLNSPEILKENFVPSIERTMSDDGWKQIIRHSWLISPSLSIQMTNRFKQSVVQNEVYRLIVNNSADAVRVSDALPLLLGDKLNNAIAPQLKVFCISYIPPITAVSYFSVNYNHHPLVLQYAMRSLEYHPVDIVFFYIPQIVQALGFDNLGYVERFIMNAAKISQLFAHQIIWNMKANMYRDDESQIPDPLKPTLERVIENIVDSLSGEDKAFYEREFTFFNAVTSISGKLKPYIKKSKLEKKAKIDEEMAKIKVDVGVYLPSNPEGKVIGIDYKSGRPLQSHAKAPFMATFRIRKDATDSEDIKETIIQLTNGNNGDNKTKTVDVWQSAIFKVGDDCRQDVLALQLIAIFKNIFTTVGLDLYLFPYRVVATAPGCGMIDVIPNSISRDQLGRERVNSLYDYFLATYGGVESIAFQKARNCFIQSAAAYSVVSFLLQIKDRHNGNIMLDNEGHIIHIDFGFILDIAPGGITFESSPFKLTTEMIQVMGGNAEGQQFKWFSELCIKAYLASRPYAENICQVVGLMLGSELPCFKGDTLKRLRDRFQVGRTERRAADYMVEKINQSFENKRTVLYDSFQKATNGIPH
ncbi:12972_t:CDS:10 [Acaulospora morrowiae]|uniref:1-phosphatidylinositol 4-kinase n=1 Tax=Acaulospora morrowiae TaxID=94023 RepID=A0A9N8V631_9GLOM|nr:12972_t:CDS:10 [Acaulospora morrowiae]